ncbi:MAG: hypothetical protein QOE61_1542 [Micromonosporaceae bacterium]|nr:hypothetical protein [Micromonosporaceae bacterium]
MLPYRWLVIVTAAILLSGCSEKANDVDQQRIATMKADQVLPDDPHVFIRVGFDHGPNIVSGEPPGNDTAARADPLTPQETQRRTVAILQIMRGEGWIVLYTECTPSFQDYPPRTDPPVTALSYAANGYRNIDDVSYIFDLRASGGGENHLRAWLDLSAPFHSAPNNSFPDTPTGLTPQETCIEAGDPMQRTPQTNGTIRDLVHKEVTGTN